MTNAEKYLKKGVDILDFACEIEKANQLGEIDESICTTTCRWLSQETKPTLTEDERVILRNMKNVSTIKRDKEGDLVVYKISTGVYYIVEFNHLFQFIKERRRILY